MCTPYDIQLHPTFMRACAHARMQAELEYCGTTSFFMRVLLDKKYALPYRVIDALVGARVLLQCSSSPGCCDAHAGLKMA